MNKYGIVAVLGCCVCFFLFFPNKKELKTLNENKIPDQKIENPAEPYEHFSFVRSFPDEALDVKAYEAAIHEAQNILTYKSSSSANIPWQLEGPKNIGGRITCVAVHPTNSNIIFAGCPGGGLFKTTNGGTTWSPVFDAHNYLSIASITFDPSNTNIIYVGTGDPDTPFTAFVGDGIYKSSDGGNTWTNIGLAQQKIISKIIVHPSNSNIIYAAAQGLPMQRDNFRGVYKTTNGGSSWQQVLFINNETGVSDIVLNPSNPNELYATSWSRIRTYKESLGYSNTSRVYKTTDAGANWSMLTNGLPNEKVSRYGICMSKQNPNKLYVSVCDSTYNLKGIYRTTNGGTSFTQLNTSSIPSSLYSGFGWYFGRLYVDPNDDNDIFILGVEMYRSTDGGSNWFMNSPPWWTYDVHADQHDLQFISSTNYIVATDGGLYQTTDDGVNYTKVDDIPNTQFYRVEYDPYNPTEYCGGAQDNGTMSGDFSNINFWPRLFGGDGFQPRFDNTDANNYFYETQNGGLWVTTDGGFNFDPGDTGINPADRCNWDMPYTMSSVNSNIMYTGTYRVYENTSGAFPFWTAISNDLTDGIIYGARFHTISAIDHSQLNSQIIYVGTSDGNVWRTLNKGTSWDSLHNTLPYRYVTSIHASPNVVNNVYVTHSGYRHNSYIPHIHKSTNNGTTWTDISSNLPQAGINDVFVMPGNENVIFVANDLGVYYTQNGGIWWSRLGNNMPMIPVFDIEYNPTTQRLFAGTYARSLQSIDISTILTTTSILETESGKLTKIFPNPVQNHIHFTVPENIIGSLAEVKIMDAAGRETQSNSMLLNLDNKLEVVQIPSGIYYFEVKAGKSKTVTKFIKL